MFESLWGLISRDVGIDLGTANTLVHVRGRGIVISEPSVVAKDMKTGAILAVGAEAKRMLGRTPQNIVAIRPLKDGVISDFDITEYMLKHFIHKVHDRVALFPRPRVIIGIPSGVTEVEKRAVQEAAINAGARWARLVEEPMAAAIGAGLPILEPSGSMIVDIGGGTTEVAVTSLGGIVVARSIRIGGDEMDQDIVSYARREFNLLMGERTAEDIKIAIGSAYPLDEEVSTFFRGRDLLTGLPRSIEVTSAQIREAIDPSVQQIVDAVKDTIEETPPELVADIMDQGIYLAGGGALLRGMGYADLGGDADGRAHRRRSAHLRRAWHRYGPRGPREVRPEPRDRDIRDHASLMTTLGRTRQRRTNSVARPFAALFAISLLILLFRSASVVQGAAGIGTQLLVPVQRALAETGVATDRFFQAIGEFDRIRAENADLRAANDRLTLENARLAEAAIAAQQGAKLDAAQRALPYKTIAAPVIARDPSGVLKTIVIGAGTDQGVHVDQIVLSEQGVVGRVSEAGTNYAKVLLITDSASSVSALVQKSRASGIVRGQYGDTLVMEWILQSDPVKSGDVVVTAGLGVGAELRSLYPKGLVIGTVVDVTKAEVSAYQRAVVAPAVDLRKLENVLVITETAK